MNMEFEVQRREGETPDIKVLKSGTLPLHFFQAYSHFMFAFRGSQHLNTLQPAVHSILPCAVYTPGTLFWLQWTCSVHSAALQVH